MEDQSILDHITALVDEEHRLREGVAAYRAMGTADSPGTLICTVTGSVAT